MPSSKKVKSNRRFPERNATGFSMLTMVILTVVVSITLVSTGAFLVPFIRSNARDAMTELQARAIAESSINYALALLNDPATRPDVDVSTTQDDCRELTIQPSDINLPLQTAANVKSIRLFIRNDTPPAPQNTPVQKDIFPLSYDPMLVSGLTGKFGLRNYWRTFTVLVEYGGDLNRGSYNFGAKVVVKPGFKTASEGGSGSSSFFTSALGAKDSVTMGDGSNTISSVSPPNGSIKAGGDINLSADVAIDGKIQATSDSTNIKIPELGAPFLNNTIEFTGSQPPSITVGLNPPQPLSTSTQNIDPFQQLSYLTDNTGVPKIAQTLDPVQDMPPALSPSATTPNLASVSEHPGADAYTINSTQLEQATVSDLSSISTTTKLFLQNTGDIGTPLEITSNIGSDSVAGKLQLWYNGERPLVFKGDSVYLMVYAPFANITIGDGIKKTTFTGAIVGNNVTLSKNSTIKYAIAPANNSFSNSDFDFKPNNSNAKNTIKWQIQSFKELRNEEYQAESRLTPRKT